MIRVVTNAVGAAACSHRSRRPRWTNIDPNIVEIFAIFAQSNAYSIALIIGVLIFAAAGCRTYQAPVSDPPVTACCDGLGACLPTPYVPPADRVYLSTAGCRPDTQCVPKELRGGAAPPTCRTDLGSEGRCLPSCLPQVAAQLDRLQINGCQEHQRCAPCYDPISGEMTGACSLGEDTGPSETPRVFAYCCKNLGRCVPARLVPTDQRDWVGRDICAAQDDLCVPEPLIGTEPYVPPSCMPSPLAGVGVCISSCFFSQTPASRLLSQANCNSDERCVPCGLLPDSGLGC